MHADTSNLDLGLAKDWVAHPDNRASAHSDGAILNEVANGRLS
jgi:hypothetical protein